jgi:undecaprenyl-diphosphatase
VNAVLAYVNDSDLRFSGRLRAWKPPRWFRIWMVAATRLGDGWVWLAIASLLAAGGGPHHRALAAGAVAGSVASSALVLLKRRFRRPRPCDLAAHPLFGDIKPPDRFSFPSGHTMNAFAVNVVLALQYPLLAPLLGMAAASIAASRVVLGLHYVSDVVVGALFGTLIGVTTSLVLFG